jgi:isopropylmalate/homocitrate/citramalate synthase
VSAQVRGGGSEFNRAPEVRAVIEFAADVYVVDSTIRSLQSGVSGSRHDADGLVEIGMALDGLGVRELIVNASWKHGPEVIAGLARRRPKATIVGTFRARNPLASAWTETCIDAGADEICFESPLDDDQIREEVRHVRGASRRVSFGFAERYSYEQIVRLSRLATVEGARSLAFHDSFFELGITPEAMRYFIQSVRRDVPAHPPLHVHLSNFYGQATMTGVAALSAGANAVDVCMNVTGHHCGHTSLAEVVMVLEDLYDVRTGIDLGRITEVAALVKARSGVPLPLTQPVIGDYAFMGDGAYWAAEEHLPNEQRVHARFPFDPEVVGAVERIVWSDRTATPDSIATRLGSLGLAADPGSVSDVIGALTQSLDQKRTYPGWLTDEEFADLCSSTLAGAASMIPAARA